MRIFFKSVSISQCQQALSSKLLSEGSAVSHSTVSINKLKTCMIHKPHSQSPRQVVLTKVCREIGKLFPMQTENAVIQGSGFLGKTDIT
jgi:hypothetical protein